MVRSVLLAQGDGTIKVKHLYLIAYKVIAGCQPTNLYITHFFWWWTPSSYELHFLFSAAKAFLTNTFFQDFCERDATLIFDQLSG